MDVSFSLISTFSQPTLTRLLPALLQAESVVFDGAASQLLCRGTSGQLEQVEVQLAAELKSLQIDWESHSATPETNDSGDIPLYELSALVLTILSSDSNMLPHELLAGLVEWDVELRAMRRLSPAGAQDELALELYLDSADNGARLRKVLPALSQHHGVDLVLAASDSKRPRRRMLAFDMDSTLIRCEVIDELAARAGVGEAVAAVTARAMRGELDFCSSFRERLASLEGLPSATLASVAESLPLMPGVVSLLRTLKAQGHYTVILSGGFDYFAKCLQQQLGFDEVHANTLQLNNDVLTGDVIGVIVDGERKVALLQEIAAAQGIEMRDTVAVGDGANDLPMLAAAGLGVAFHPKPLVREKAGCSVEHADLTSLLYVLGVPRSTAG
ncbi:MAG: phosphoserine phosphatase SerB [Congregibacter sp.]